MKMYNTNNIPFDDTLTRKNKVNQYIDKVMSVYLENNNIKQNNEENPMFENFGNIFNGKFGKIGDNMCRLTMTGGIAIKTANGYKTYNIAKKRLTNVSNFCFDAGDFFFVMPTAKVKVGDIILVNGKPKCVIKTDADNEDNGIKVIDYETSEIREIVPERHVFMGSTYFYGKIVSMFGAGKLKGKGIMGKIMNMMMIQGMFGGKGATGGMFGGNGNGMGLGQIMMMQQFFGKGDEGNMFENMFGLEFGEDEDTFGFDTDNDDDDDEETPKPKKRKRTKPAKKAKKVVVEEDEEDEEEED